MDPQFGGSVIKTKREVRKRGAIFGPQIPRVGGPPHEQLGGDSFLPGFVSLTLPQTMPYQVRQVSGPMSRCLRFHFMTLLRKHGGSRSCLAVQPQTQCV